MPSTIVIALGGNALQQNGEATATAQERVAALTAAHLVPLVRAGNRIVIVHGNGPQVGNIVLHEEAINTPEVPTLPLDSSVAMSQGLIGYWLQQALTNELRKSGIATPVAAVVTRVLVDPYDPAFSDPAKPIGPFYATEAEAAKAAAERGFIVKKDADRGWRRVVPSPRPSKLIEIDTIHQLLQTGAIVIAAGGGGVPVVMTDDGYKGIEAVVDKDFSAAVLADAIGADTLQILTTVDAAMIYYGTPQQQKIGNITVEKMQHFVTKGQFAAGSMLPKVEASLQFIRSGNNRRANITSIDYVVEAVEGRKGTVIHE